MKLVQRINTGVSIAILSVCAGAYLLFGWSATGWKALAIPTGSMRPTILPGSLVLVRRVPVSSLKIGDVVTHVSPLNPTVTLSHRIIRINTLNDKVTTIVTKGDANVAADIPFTPSKVIGKVVWHAPDIGWLLIDSRKPVVMLPIIYLAGLFIVLEEAQRLTMYYRKYTIYRLPGFVPSSQKEHSFATRANYCVAIAAALVVISAATISPTVEALRSNVVSLSANHISTTLHATSPGQCVGDTNNTIRVSNSTNQTGDSGSAAVSGNGLATSGSVSNTSSSSITVTIGC